MQIKAIVGASCALILLAGCETAPQIAPATAKSQTTAQENVATPTVSSAKPESQNNQNNSNNPQKPKEAPAAPQIVRYIGTKSDQWQTSETPQSYADLYTRFELFGPDSTGSGTGPNPNLRDYNSENRSWFSRLWQSETDTVTTVANIEIRDPELKLSIPLFSVSHVSARDLGNTWTTNFTSSNVESPLFRIGPNTGLTIHLSAKASSDLKSQGAAMAIGAVMAAVQIAAPSSTLLTTLSKSNVDNKAHAVDKAISGLLSHDISEDIELGRLTDSWSKSSYLLLYGCAPFVRTEVPSTDPLCGSKSDLDDARNTLVGTWKLKLACPRMSVFDSRDICNPIGSVQPDKDKAGNNDMIDLSKNAAAVQTTIARDASDAQIMSFNLSPNVSVQAFAQSQSWYTTFIGGTKKEAAEFTNFCANALLGLEMSGLNRFDAAQAIRAMFRQLPQLVALNPDFKTKGEPAENCVQLLQQSNVAF